MPNFFGVPVSRMAVLKKRKLRRADTLEAPENVELPEITGVFAPDEVLTVSNGTWLNDPTSFAYQWYVNDVPIDGATENTFTVTETDGETEVKADVTASNAGGDTTATSDPVALVFNITPASISGTNTIGQTLTGTPGMWSGSPTLTYQWRRNGTNISGQTGSTYLLVDADFGATIDWLEIPNGDTGAAVASAATGAVNIAYAIYAPFTTDDAAPLDNPYVASGGSLVTAQVDGQLSVSSGKLQIPAQTTAAWGDLGISSTQARAAGKIFRATYRRSSHGAGDANTGVGWMSSLNANNMVYGLDFGAGGLLYLLMAGSFRQIGAYSLDTDYTVTHLLFATGSAVWIKGGTWTENTLIFLEEVSTTANPLGGVANMTPVGTLDDLLIRTVGAPLTTPNGFAKINVTSPVSEASHTAAANAIHKLLFTLNGSPAADEVAAGIKYRVLDANNYWYAYIKRNAGNTAWDFRLDRVASGTPNNHLNVTGVGTPNGLLIRCNGNLHDAYTLASETPTKRGSQVDQSHQNTQTAVQAVFAAGTTVSNLRAWPVAEDVYDTLDLLPL